MESQSNLVKSNYMGKIILVCYGINYLIIAFRIKLCNSGISNTEHEVRKSVDEGKMKKCAENQPKFIRAVPNHVHIGNS